MSVTARGITAGVAAIAMGAFAVMAIAQQNEDPAQQRQRQREGRQTQQAGNADQVWGQVAELHRRIVQMEISQQATPGQETPGQPGQREGAQREREGARNQPGQAAQRGDEQPGQPGGRTSPFTAGQSSRSDALWNQLAEKHKQLVQMKLGGDQTPGAQRATPERGAAGQEPGQERAAQRDQPGQTAPDRQTASATEELEKEIGELYLQILEVDIAEARGSREVLRPELNDQNPTPRPGQRTPRTPEQNPDN